MATLNPSMPAPAAPGSLGVAAPAPELLAYLDKLESWLKARRDEVDRLDAAARETTTPDEYSGDIVLALSLWQAIRTRADEIEEVWDSGRADAVGREKISQLLWGRLDAGAGASFVSLVEAATLCDAIVVQLRGKLAFEPAAADQASRLRAVRAEIVRCEDLTDDESRGRVAALAGRHQNLVAQAERGADVSGPLAELEAEVARTERDLIVGVAQRRELRRDRERTRATRDALQAREPALRDLAARCRREIAGPPKLAVPDVDRLGEVPDDRAGLDAFDARLAAVSRAFDAVEDAYTKPLRERAELRFRLTKYEERAQANGRLVSAATSAGLAEAHEAIAVEPCDVLLAAFYVEQCDILTQDLPTRSEGDPR